MKTIHFFKISLAINLLCMPLVACAEYYLVTSAPRVSHTYCYCHHHYRQHYKHHKHHYRTAAYRQDSDNYDYDETTGDDDFMHYPDVNNQY